MGTRAIFFAVFLAGVASLQMELSLLREATFVLGTTAFTNSYIISIFLGGLAIGCYGGNRLTSIYKDKAKGIFVISQVALILLVLAFLFTKNYVIYYNYRTRITLPYFLVMTLIPSTVAGMSFSLFMNMLYARGEKYVARVYAISTLGNVVGGLLHGMVIVPYWGMIATYALVILCTGAAVLLVGRFSIARNIAAAALVLGTGWLACAFRPLPAEIAESLIYSRDDIYGLVQVYDRSKFRAGRGGEKGIDVFIHGSYNCGNSEEDLARHENSAEQTDAILDGRGGDVLMLGYCSGSTIDAYLGKKNMRSIVSVDQNKTVMEMTKIFFADIYRRVARDPRIRIEIDEFKRYLRRQPPERKFDAAMIDITIHDPYFLSMNTLEFFREINAHLNRPGVLSMNFLEKKYMRTAAEVFEHVYSQTGGAASGWLYFTNFEIPPGRQALLNLKEIFPRREPGTVYSDHAVYRLTAGERIQAKLK